MRPHKLFHASTFRALSVVSVLISGCTPVTNSPASFGPIPSAAQLDWHQREMYAFVHFSPNTFTGREWGYGDESPRVFHPTEFDPDQIVGVLADAGMTAVILTCKHHDGFALWDSAHTTHDVAASPWRDGNGDVVREIADACARRGLGFGVYLSPWDRNHPDYGRPEYVDYFRAQLRELLTNYGPIAEVWFDGANGGDGYYGGARERREIDRATYYGWPQTFELVRQLQPGAVIFSDIGPDVRWVGNESGFAGDPCWAAYDPEPSVPGQPASPGATRYQLAENGHRAGGAWMPAEADVSIRPGWFYHGHEDDKVRSPDNLFDLYVKSVGRGASLLLNVPPDTRGRIHEADAASLSEFGRLLRQTFDTDLAAGASWSASSVRGGANQFRPEALTDGDPATYWSTDDTVLAGEVVLSWPEPRTFNTVSVREYLPLGQRVDAWGMDAWVEGAWREFAKGESIGPRRIVWIEDVKTNRVRLRIERASACPALSEFSLHLGPSR